MFEDGSFTGDGGQSDGTDTNGGTPKDIETYAKSIGWKVGKTTGIYVRSGFVGNAPGYGMMSSEAMADLYKKAQIATQEARLDEYLNAEEAWFNGTEGKPNDYFDNRQSELQDLQND